ncbi:transporter [Massilia arenosa]|uniref:Transporter n=1 Tax=Zemynaea arenosa TaxID=2561931 RepID=A0A4Y9SCE1_9BURK|nr:transporter [Massilia arenosa]TFW19737.1 transporter [Massilia arenosa]
MKNRFRLALAASALAALPAVHAQQQPAQPTSEAVRDALAKKADDTDQTSLLKETLTAVDKQYTLIKRGQTLLTYDLNYAYIGQEKINTDLSSGNATLFSIENQNSHTFTNTLLVDYGLRDNVTASVTLPFVSRYSDSDTFNGTSNSIGDITLGARVQPFSAQRDQASLTFTSSLRLPTGDSPFKVDPGKGLATGSGLTTLTLGMNVNKIVDPVALFGSFNVGASAPAKHLSQNIGGAKLKTVRPGSTIGFGMGFAYALSYKITTSFSFQEQISAGSRLSFDNGREAKTSTQSAGILSIGAGYRMSPKTTLNVVVGIGLTAAAPNMNIDVSLPLSF